MFFLDLVYGIIFTHIFQVKSYWLILLLQIHQHHRYNRNDPPTKKSFKPRLIQVAHWKIFFESVGDIMRIVMMDHFHRIYLKLHQFRQHQAIRSAHSIDEIKIQMTHVINQPVKQVIVSQGQPRVDSVGGIISPREIICCWIALADVPMGQHFLKFDEAEWEMIKSFVDFKFGIFHRKNYQKYHCRI